jgi:predicted nucleotidyltransferase
VVEVPEKVMSLARDVARLVRERVAPDARVLLFGSWAQGTAFPRSDLDIAVSVGTPIRGSTLVRVEDAFEQLKTLRKIDLVDLESAGAELRAEILAHGIEL